MDYSEEGRKQTSVVCTAVETQSRSRIKNDSSRDVQDFLQRLAAMHPKRQAAKTVKPTQKIN